MKKSKSLDYEFYTLESSNDSNKSIAKARKICITRENPGLLRPGVNKLAFPPTLVGEKLLKITH